MNLSSGIELAAGQLGVQADTLREVDFTTPHGKRWWGYICHRMDHRYGALAVRPWSDVFGSVAPSPFTVIYGMPKLHYPFGRTDYAGGEIKRVSFPGSTRWYLTAKLDGTNICFYTIDGHEVLAKTRITPLVQDGKFGAFYTMLHSQFPEQVKRISSYIVECRRSGRPHSVCCEMWGGKNPHLIQYENELQLTLLCVVKSRNGRLMDWNATRRLGDRLGLHQPEILWSGTDISTAYFTVRKQIEEANRSAGKLMEEGAVARGRGVDMMFKLKPSDIQELHFEMAGQRIDDNMLIQALHKALENLGDEFCERGVELARDILLEDYSEERVDKSLDALDGFWRKELVIMAVRARALGALGDRVFPDAPSAMRFLASTGQFQKSEMSAIYQLIKNLAAVHSST